MIIKIMASRYKNIYTILVFCTFSCGTKAATLLDTYQLPLSQRLLKTFPKTKLGHFIIAVPKLGIVLHQFNSNTHVRCGNFSIMLENIASLTQETLTPNIDKFLEQYGRPIPQRTDIVIQDYGISLSLYTICNVFEHEYLYILKNHKDKWLSNKVKIFFFYSANNIGCICRYININNVAFDIISYSNETKKIILKDLRLITQWLDKFTIEEVSAIPTSPIYIPVFYGKQQFIQFLPPKMHELLIEKGKIERIEKITRYLMRITAPVAPSNNTGQIFYRYSIFQNPVKFNIYSNVTVKKSNAFKNLLDSICYIIYNRPHKSTLNARNT